MWIYSKLSVREIIKPYDSFSTSSLHHKSLALQNINTPEKYKSESKSRNEYPHIKASNPLSSRDKKPIYHSSLGLIKGNLHRDSSDSMLSHPYFSISDKQKKIIEKCRGELKENLKLKFDIKEFKKKGFMLYQELSQNSDKASKQLCFDRIKQRYSKMKYFPENKLL